MMEAVQPGPQGQAALLSCLTRQERGAESSSKGLRRVGRGELEALSGLAELQHCKPLCCPSLFEEQI